MNGLEDWIATTTAVDWIGVVLWFLVFPVYHAVYPSLVRRMPGKTTKGRVDLYRRSWIQRLLESGDVLVGVHQARNLTMVNSLLASSALILMGFTANAVLQSPGAGSVAAEDLLGKPGNVEKLWLLIVVFGVAFTYFMAALRHLGFFNIMIGADPKVVEEHEGSSIDFLVGLISRASSRYTNGVRCFYSAFPLFMWVFHPWLFVGMTTFFAIKFIGFQDFAHAWVKPSA